MQEIDYIVSSFKTALEETELKEEEAKVLSFIMTLLADSHPKRLTKAHLSRTFKINRLTIKVDYN